MSKVYSFRFDERTAAELQEVSALFRMSPVAFLTLTIHQEYEKAQGNPKIHEAMDLLEELTALTERMGSVFK